MRLIINDCGGTAFAVTVSMPNNAQLCNIVNGGGITRQRPCAWCINCADGCASTLTLHYHKEGWSNFLGTGSSKMLATAVIDIWEV